MLLPSFKYSLINIATKQKYSVIISPLTNGPFEVDIKHQSDGEWVHSVNRKVNSSGGLVTLHKYASNDAIYSFCIINSGRDNFTARA